MESRIYDSIGFFILAIGKGICPCYNSDKNYLNSYISYLKNYSNNQYFNIDYINDIYKVAENNYANVYKPTINELMSKSIHFTMNDSNYSISEFIKNIKENINNI